MLHHSTTHKSDNFHATYTGQPIYNIYNEEQMAEPTYVPSQPKTLPMEK